MHADMSDNPFGFDTAAVNRLAARFALSVNDVQCK